jgi:DNA primase
MAFPESIINDIKQRIPPSEVVGRKVSLRSKGPGEFSGLCPFHKEKTPSFTVSDQKGFYHCFGCGANGDIFKFLAESEGMKFNEAVEYLAKEAGIRLPEYSASTSAEDLARQEKLKVLYVILEEANQFFMNQLQLPSGKIAKDYLLGRGFTPDIISLFKLGYVPDQWHGLHHYLKQKGFSDKQMLDVGLLSKNERGEMYDRFRGRVMFPIMDAAGKVVAFGGRVLDKQEPKYLNSPETEIFKKGRLLYNYHIAKKYAHQTGALVVTEGYVDTIALHKAGISHTVASLGTAITQEQLQLLWRLSRNPIICLDGDAAGMRAMERVAHVVMPMLKPGYTLMFAQIPASNDPDDIVRKQGVEAMKQILAQAKPLSEVIWASEYQKQDITLPEHKADLEKRLMQLASQIEDKAVSTHYRSFFNQQLWQLGSRKKTNVGQPAGSSHLLKAPLQEEAVNIHTIEGCELVLMMVISSYPELLKFPEVYEEWLNIEFSSNKLDNLRSIILQMADSMDGVTKEDVEIAFCNAGYQQDVLYFKTLKNRGIIPIAQDTTLVRESWNYMLNRYHLVALKSEYTEMLQQMTEEALQRAYGLKQQMEQLEMRLNQAELAFGDER